MGFYGGNITNSNKTSFSFDRIYSTRAEMDEACLAGDGVFLGRYVLVEYDQPVVFGYFNPTTNKLYHDPTYKHEVLGSQHLIYQDIKTKKIYLWQDAWVEDSTIQSPYAKRYLTDVEKYGRGYDSTAWVKRFDEESNNYHYVMIAELNTVVPTFHMLIDGPTEESISPYFDKDSTNLNYYLHYSPVMESKIAEAHEGDKSDTEITQTIKTWDVDSYKQGIEKCRVSSKTAPAQIYWNKKGFDKTIRTREDVLQDSVGYNETESGRLYAGDIQHPYSEPKLDQKEWYLNLPSLGNAICDLWDLVYTQNRRQKFASANNDSEATYDQESVIGLMNNIRKLMGFTFERTSGALLDKTTVDDKIYYTVNPVTQEPEHYYYYAYNPTFEPQENGEYIKPDPNVEFYELANLALVEGKTRYNKIDNYVPVELIISEKSFAGLLFTLHKLIGTGTDTFNNPETILGSIGQIEHIIANISKELAPSRLMRTDENGVITTSDTVFPILEDTSRVLEGTGKWEHRVASLQVGEKNLAPTMANKDTLSFEGDSWITPSINEATSAIAFSHNDANPALKKADLVPTYAWTPPLEGAPGDTGIGVITSYYPVYDQTGHIVDKKSLNFSAPDRWILLNEEFADDKKTVLGYSLKHGGQYWDATETWGTPTLTEGVLSLPNLSWDEHGHIRGRDYYKFSLPNNYSTITAQNSAGLQLAENETLKSNDVSATTPLDSLTIVTGKNLDYDWNDKEGKFSLLHAKTDRKTELGETFVDHSTLSLNKTADSNLTLVGYNCNSDDCGHIMSWTQKNISIEPDHWINIDMTPLSESNLKEKITFSHKTIFTGNQTVKLEKNAEKDSWSIPIQEFDTAGHLVKSTESFCALPKAFKTFQVGDKTLNAVTSEDSLTIQGSTLINVLAENNNLVIKHQNSAQTATAIQMSIMGESAFDILRTDDQGHIVAANTSVIQIPSAFQVLKVVDPASKEKSVIGSIQPQAGVGYGLFVKGNSHLSIGVDPQDGSLLHIDHRIIFSKDQNAGGAVTYDSKTQTVTLPNVALGVDMAGHINEIRTNEKISWTSTSEDLTLTMEEQAEGNKKIVKFGSTLFENLVKYFDLKLKMPEWHISQTENNILSVTVDPQIPFTYTYSWSRKSAEGAYTEVSTAKEYTASAGTYRCVLTANYRGQQVSAEKEITVGGGKA